MKQKLKTQPQIPRTLKDQIETIEDDRFTNQPGKSGKLPRKLLRKRKKEEKKQRKRLYHNKIPIPEPAPPKPPREKRPFPAEPPRKKPKLEKPPPSKPIKPAISAEDAEIAYYERKLKRKGSKKTHSQLDDILNGISTGNPDYDPTKKSFTHDEFDEESDFQQLNQDSDSDHLDDPDSELSDSDNLDDFDQLNEDYDSVDGSDEEMDEEDQSELEDQPVIEKSKPSLQKAKEIETKQEVLLKSNPTPDSSSTSTQKYVPPRLRQLNEGDQIRKRLRGLLNRVSEANVSILVAEIQTIFETTPRNLINAVISESILNDCAASATQSTLLPVYGVLLSLLHYRVGSDVGGNFLNKWFMQFSQYRETNAKEAAINCVKLVGYLYCYQILHCSLIFDLIRNFIGTLDEIHIELLLALLKITGLSLRSDDPSSLKDIILAIQEQVDNLEVLKQKSVQEEFGIRIKFMLEMIYDLKSNRKKYFSSDPTPSTLMKLAEKASKSSTSEQLHVSLEELSLLAPKEQKWWSKGVSILHKQSNSELELNSANEKVLRLAKKQGMNTDAKRSIFVSIMSAEDYLDAFENLIKLPLKGKQDREIVYVLMHCCISETSFNPFYGHLANKLCSFNTKFRYTFQLAFWDRFKRINDEKLSVLQCLAQLLSQLLAHGSVSLGVFKIVEFAKLSAEEVMFYRVVFHRLFCDFEKDTVLKLFDKLATNPQMWQERESLLLFLTQAFKKSALLNNKIYSESDAKTIYKLVKQIQFTFRHAPIDMEDPRSDSD